MNDLSSGSTIPAFRRHVTLLSKAVGRCVFYEVGVIPNIQYIVKEKQAISSSQNFFFNLPLQMR
jgi:hypothetical protein